MKILAQLLILQAYCSHLFLLYSTLQLCFAPNFLPVVVQYFLLLPLQPETPLGQI